MTDKEFRRLSRRQLIDIIFELQKREALYQSQLEEMQEQLLSKEMKISEAGNIAEAVLSLHEVFERAQAAADQYLAAAEHQYEVSKKEAERIVEEAQEQAQCILNSAYEEQQEICVSGQGDIEYFST